MSWLPLAQLELAQRLLLSIGESAGWMTGGDAAPYSGDPAPSLGDERLTLILSTYLLQHLGEKNALAHALFYSLVQVASRIGVKMRCKYSGYRTR